MSTKRLDLGAVSAYAMAVEQGYRGTEEEFGLILANAANYAAESKDAKTAAEAAAGESAGSAQAAEGYKTAAGKILEDVHAEGTTQIQAISTAGEEQIQALEAKGTEQIQTIETAGTEQIEAAKAEIDEKGKQTLDSIPEDYTGLQTEVDELKEDLADNAKSDAETRRKLDYLWKLNQGISYQFETDEARAYIKTVPSGAKLASVKEIGGKTVVWNQLVNKDSIPDTKIVNGVTFTNNEDGSISITGIPSSYEGTSLSIIQNTPIIAGRKYLVKGFVDGGTPDTYRTYINIGGTSSFNDESHIHNAINNSIEFSLRFDIYKVESIDFVIKPQVFDLTKMFGSENEPATVEEFEAMFPNDYYEYNEGTLMSAPVNDVVITDMSGTISNTVQLPQAILDLDGYGDSVSDVAYNFIDFENKKYHKRVGKVDLGTLSWTSKELISTGFFVSDVFKLARGVCFTNNYIARTHSSDWNSWGDNVISHNDGYRGNSTGNAASNIFIIKDTSLSGKTGVEVKQYLNSIFCYYELAEEEIIDISDILTDGILENLEVEAGGTLTFQNSNGGGYRIPVPNTEEYVISLAEVGGV